jgi:hypothetical protein
MLKQHLFFISFLVLLIPTLTSADVYNIELILFERHAENQDVWSTSSGEPDFNLAKNHLSRMSAHNTSLLAEKALGKVTDTLYEKGLQIHSHLNWRQHVPDRANKIWYAMGGQRIGGVISISRGRYLHLDADLLLRDGENHRIQLNRRMRSGELHYLDHPKIGIIVIAEKIDTETDVSTIPVETENTVPQKMPGELNPAVENSLPRATPDPS